MIRPHIIVSPPADANVSAPEFSVPQSSPSPSLRAQEQRHSTISTLDHRTDSTSDNLLSGHSRTVSNVSTLYPHSSMYPMPTVYTPNGPHYPSVTAVAASPPTAGLSVHVIPTPSKFIGAIIGRDGRTIRNIRRRSNAEIKISEPRQNRAERYITILGTAQQICTAVGLIVNSMNIRK